MKVKKKKKSKDFVKAMVKKVSKGETIKPTKASDLDIVQFIIKKLKKKGKDITDLRTYRQVNKHRQEKLGHLYILAVTQDCPSDYITAGGFDFPKFVQPVDTSTRRLRALSRRVGARPQRLKRSMLSKAEVQRILESAHDKWIDISLPTGEVNEDTGTPVMYHDKIRASYFLVLQRVRPDEADPIEVKPLLKRDADIRKLVRKASEVERQLGQAKAVKQRKGTTHRNIEAFKHGAAAMAA